MPLSPADFYAYSRATGTPYPEEPEERAQLAPQVLEFRRNQLKAPRQEENQGFNLTNALGIGAALAGLGAGAYGLRRALGARAKVASELPNVPRGEGVDVGAIGNIVRKAAESELPTGETYSQLSTQTNVNPSQQPPGAQERLNVYQKVAATPATDLPKVYRPRGGLQDIVSDPTEAEVLITDPNTGEMYMRGRSPRGFTPRQYLEQNNTLEPNDLTSIQDSTEQIQATQVNKAVNAGHQQQDNQVMHAVQLNEDLDVGLINQIKNQTGNAITATALTPDGTPDNQLKFNTSTQVEYEGKPYRYTVLPRGGVEEGAEAVSPLLTEGKSKYEAYGLTAPETHVINDDLKFQIQDTLQRQGNKLETHQKQALTLFETTGDPEYLSSAFASAPAMTYKGRLPGGESVLTKELYIPIGERVNPQTGEAVLSSREEALFRAEGPQGIRSRAREQALQKIEESTGIRPVYPSEQQLQNLPVENKRALRLAQRDVDEANSRLQQAKDFAINYALSPEAKLGTYVGPEFNINPLTGSQVFTGMKPKVEQSSITTPLYYQLKAAGNVSRTDLGGIGRRREALAEQGFQSTGSLDDPIAFLYKDVDTGEIFEPGQVTRQDVATEKVTPIRGTAVEPQRLMGTEGRSFKGVSSLEIDPRSFDSGTRAELAQQYPERVTPEGLIYSQEAMIKPSDAPQYGRKYGTRPPTVGGKEALDVSLELNRLQRSGNPSAAQAFLDKIIEEKGISALGASLPLRQRMNPKGRYGI